MRACTEPSLRHACRWALALALVICCAQVLMAADKETGKSPANASDKAKPPAATIDDELLKDLTNDLLKDAGDLRERDSKKVRKRGGEDEGKDTPTPDAAVEETDKPGEAADPLAHVSDEMRSLERLIPKPASRAHAEALQQRVVGDLARLIEQAEQQRARQQSSSQQSKSPSAKSERSAVKQPQQGAAGQPSKDSDKPARDSTDRLGQAEAARPDAEALRGMMKDSWGHLPPKAREQMLQNSPERFLPQYELLIEKYYQRLAEEQRGK